MMEDETYLILTFESISGVEEVEDTWPVRCAVCMISNLSYEDSH